MIQARQLQKDRYGEIRLNGNAPFALFSKLALLTDRKREKLQTVCFEEKWSNRTQTKLMRIARTIADLAGELEISDQSIQEAVKWKRIASDIQNISIGVPGHG